MSKTDRQTDTQQRGSHWMLTWNNPVPKDRDSRFEKPLFYSSEDIEEANAANLDLCCHKAFRDALALGWTFDGQEEESASGTHHYQFWVNTHKQVRWRAVKKVFYECHIEKTVNKSKAESYCRKLASRKTDNETDVDEKYTTKMFWEDLARIWPDFKDISEDEMECFDSATRCLIDSDIPCWMLAVQPQVRKAFQLYGPRIMAQYARKDEAKNIYETPGEEQSDSELHEAEPSECSSEGSEESDEEDGEGSDQDTEGSSESSSEGSIGDEVCS